MGGRWGRGAIVKGVFIFPSGRIERLSYSFCDIWVWRFEIFFPFVLFSDNDDDDGTREARWCSCAGWRFGIRIAHPVSLSVRRGAQ